MIGLQRRKVAELVREYGLAASADGKTLYLTSSQLNRSADFSKDNNPSFKYPFMLKELPLGVLDKFPPKENAAAKKK